MGLREIVLDDSHSCSARLDAYCRLATTDMKDSSTHELVNELLKGSYTSQMLGFQLAARHGNEDTLQILYQILEDAVPENEVECLNISGKALQATVQLDPDNSGKLLTRMISLSPNCEPWKTIVIAAAVLAPCDQAVSFCRSLLGDEVYRKWHPDVKLALAQFGDQDAIRGLEQQIYNASNSPRYIKSIAVLARADRPKAKRILIELLEQFESLEDGQRNELYLHISNLYNVYASPSEAVREVLAKLTGQE